MVASEDVNEGGAPMRGTSAASIGHGRDGGVARHADDVGAWHAAAREADARFVRRVLIATGLVLLVLFLWEIRHALLLTFTAGVIAVLVSAAAELPERWFGLARRHGVVATVVLLLAATVVAAWLVGAQASQQVRDLAAAVPKALTALQDRLGLPAGATGGESKGGADLVTMWNAFVGPVTSFGLGAATALTEAILVVIGAAYLAIAPDLYVDGVLKLAPRERQPHLRQTILACGHALRRWAAAQAVAMVLVGTMAGLGSWALGLPSPVAIGLFAGITEFVPVLGPIAGSVPPLVLALGHGYATAAWTLGLFIVIQQVESNLITPLIQDRMVSIPPALMLFSVIAFGLLFGWLGLLVAAPLTVVAMVAVQKLYVQDTLGVEVKVAGEAPDGRAEDETGAAD